MLHTVIMAGGSGTRFWPQSRRALPKQFLHIGTDRTLIQETADRCEALSSTERTWVVTGERHAEETLRQLPLMPADQLIVEPCARNTAPCIALAAIRLLAVDPDATMLVVPADHVINPATAFHNAVEQAAAHVQRHPGHLVLFGVTPSYPATGFGYIQRGNPLTAAPAFLEVQRFREKPDLPTAAEYVAAGDCYWNCGIFVWKAATIVAELAQHEPAIGVRCRDLMAEVGATTWPQTLAAEFPQWPSISIDYAVLERSRNVCLLPAAFGWDDVGSWQALSRLIPDDDTGNTIDARHCGVETQNCIVRGPQDHLIATAGVNDLVIVHTPEVTLVAHRGDEAAIKRLLAELERRGLSEYL